MIYDLICIGSGSATLGCVFNYLSKKQGKILIIEKDSISSGGLRNDCKINCTFPVGFPETFWNKIGADNYLFITKSFFEKYDIKIKPKGNLSKYIQKANRLNVDLLDIEQSHLGTDGGIKFIKTLTSELISKDVEINYNETFLDYSNSKDGIHVITTNNEYITKKLFIAPGRHGFETVKDILFRHNIKSKDNFIDIGVRVETTHDNYKIVDDYYDPKFLFKKYKTRTFCTNSGNAKVVQEKYDNFYTVNGHAYSSETKPNGMVNFAILKSVKFTEPLASGHDFAKMLANMFMLAGGGHPLYQRVEDIRLHKRSTIEGEKNFDFEPTLKSAIPGDITLCMPSKFFNAIWSTLKSLDTIVPGVMNPSTILYAPEIKFYSQTPEFINDNFELEENVFGCGDGFGTSRGITAAWASGIRASIKILEDK